MLVDDDNFAIFNDIVNITGKQHVRAQRGGHVVHQHDIGRRVQRLAFIHNAFIDQQLFNQHQAAFGQVDLARFLINGEMPFAGKGLGVFFFLADQMRDDFVHFLIHFRTVFSRARNDKRSTCFIDEDGVDFIHQRIVQFALYAFFRAERHVVAQIVKAIFVVGAVSNIGGVGFALGWRRQARHVNPNAHTEELKQRTVVLRITLRQIVVDGDHVNTFAGQRIKICW